MQAGGQQAQLVQALGWTYLHYARRGAQQLGCLQQVPAHVQQHGGHVRIALARGLGQHALQHRLQYRQLVRQARYGSRHVRIQQVGGVVGGVGDPPGQHLEEHRAQAVLVGAAVERVA